MPDILISEDAKFVAVRLSDGNFAINRARPPQFTAQNWQTAYLVDAFIPPQVMKKRTTTADENVFICEDGLCTIPLRDGRMLAYTAQEDMREIACNVGDIVVLAIAGKELSCERSNSVVISRQELALKGTLEISLGHKLPTDTAAHSKLPNKESMGATETYRFAAPKLRNIGDYADRLSFSVDAPTRPWHLYRLYSRAARGLPDREYRKKAGTENSAGYNPSQQF